MISPAQFIGSARELKLTLFAGVPCSSFGSLLAALETAPDVLHVPCANEGDAMALLCGARLGGRSGIAYMQNSGLGNAVNPLTSLAHASGIPLVLLIGHRGDPRNPPDEPQHRLMGAITLGLLDLLQIPWRYLPESDAEVGPCLRGALEQAAELRRPSALLVRPGSFEGEKTFAGVSTTRAISAAAAAPVEPTPARYRRTEFLRAVLATVSKDAVIVSTTGYTSRDLNHLADRPNHFYVVGAMGCASSVAAGLALVRPERDVVVVDGDGAALMRLGALAAVGLARPRRLVHVLLDNHVHESTGGQPTLSRIVDFPAVARALGYPRVACCSSPDELAAELQRTHDGPSFLYCRTLVEQSVSPRPKLGPQDVSRRLMGWLEPEPAAPREASP